MKRRMLTTWLFGLSGLIPLLALLGPQPDPTLLIYSLFVLLYFVQRRRGSGAREVSSAWGFGLAILGGGLLLECLSWSSNFIRCNPQPALMHPQLLPDLLLGLAFYGAWSIAWLLLLRAFAFSLRQIFLTQALFGVLIEQRGMIFLAGLMTLPLGLLLWLYVFVVYGAVAGIAFLLCGRIWPERERRDRWWKYPLAWLLIAALTLALIGAWHAALDGAGLLPAPRAICAYPLR